MWQIYAILLRESVVVGAGSYEEEILGKNSFLKKLLELFVLAGSSLVSDLSLPW